jgi:hypothetical protein
MSTDEWVKQVNRLAREIDEIAASMHPSAWPEQLGELFRKYERLAKVMPDDEPKKRNKIRDA